MKTQEQPTGWRRTASEIVVPGLVAGVLAGTVMMLGALVHSAVAGLGFTWPLHRVADAAIAGQATAQGGASAVIGAAVHLAISAVWGVLFVALVPRGAPLPAAVGLGVVFGLMVFLVMTWMVVPWANDALWQTVSPSVLFLYHLVFGAVLPLGVPLRRQITRGVATSRRATI